MSAHDLFFVQSRLEAITGFDPRTTGVHHAGPYHDLTGLREVTEAQTVVIQ